MKPYLRGLFLACCVALGIVAAVYLAATTASMASSTKGLNAPGARAGKSGTFDTGSKPQGRFRDPSRRNVPAATGEELPLGKRETGGETVHARLTNVVLAGSANKDPTGREPPAPPVGSLEDEELPPGESAGELETGGDETEFRDTPAETDRLIKQEGDDRLTIHLHDNDIRDVLAQLSEQTGLNILAGPSVTGKVSATLVDVSAQAALEAILRTKGYQSERDGRFIFVGTAQDLVLMRQSVDEVGMRIYRPNYITAKELQELITPMLSPSVGKTSVTSPAEVGIAADNNGAGGNNLAASEAVVVQDYSSVLFEIDQLVDEVDTRPAQVAIEAMILSVKLDDANQFGAAFQVLRNKQNVRLGVGTPRINPLEGSGQTDSSTGGTIGEFNFTDGGMNFAFLDESLGAFLTALESIGETNVIASPKLLCLNKQRAEILIGAQLGYISTTLTETSTSQNVNFLEVGAQLRLRPFISSDGLIRMEVHPELSTGAVRVEGGFTLPDKEVTQVTTNIMVRDGCTVVIGGLMREDLSTSTSQVPLFGSLPVVGFLFRNKNEQIERREILVLITPRIVCEPETCIEGRKGALAFSERQGIYRDQMTPLGKRHLGTESLRRAQDAWASGNERAALRRANRSIHFDPLNREAIDFRRQITGIPSGADEVPPGAGPSPVADNEIDPWLLDRLEEEGAAGYPADQGVPGDRVDIQSQASPIDDQ